MTAYFTQARFAVKVDAGITSVERLFGKTVVTTAGTTLVQRLRKLEHDNNASLNLLYGKDRADSFLLLESSRTDAVAMDDNTLAGNIANSKSPQDYKIVAKPLGMEPLSIMMRKDDLRFKVAVDGVIKEMMSSGELRRAPVSSGSSMPSAFSGQFPRTERLSTCR